MALVMSCYQNRVFLGSTTNPHYSCGKGRRAGEGIPLAYICQSVNWCFLFVLSAENFSRRLLDKGLHAEKSQNESFQGSGPGNNVYMNSTGTWHLLLCFSTMPCAFQSARTQGWLDELCLRVFSLMIYRLVTQVGSMPTFSDFNAVRQEDHFMIFSEPLPISLVLNHWTPFAICYMINLGTALWLHNPRKQEIVISEYIL